MRHHCDLVLCDYTFENTEQKKQQDVFWVCSQTLLEKLLWSAGSITWQGLPFIQRWAPLQQVTLQWSRWGIFVRLIFAELPDIVLGDSPWPALFWWCSLGSLWTKAAWSFDARILLNVKTCNYMWEECISCDQNKFKRTNSRRGWTYHLFSETGMFSWLSEALLNVLLIYPLEDLLKWPSLCYVAAN